MSDNTIKGYKLGEAVGKGGYGAVYRATQVLVGRDVAIKVILPKYANQPEFIRRFDTEAHLVARLEHPSIVPLYDYWRDPTGAYLVMRWLRGGNLSDAIKQGPLPLDKLIRFLDQIGDALAFAHRRGIVHRDLKPANILLDDEDHAYLVDFGIAKELQQTESGDDEDDEEESIVGSPWYISPEHIVAEPVTPQCDIYSLGITLFELLTGENPFKGFSLKEILVKHLYEPLPPITDKRNDLPEAINAVIHKATEKQAQDRYPDAYSMLRAFKEALGISTAPPLSDTQDIPHQAAIQADSAIHIPLDNPYKGLRAFQEADASDFFGREDLTNHLIEQLHATSSQASSAPQAMSKASLYRFLAVVGPSGSGKSSVVRAGVVPALRHGALPGSEKWFIAQMIPGTNPLEELDQALLAVATTPPPDLIQLIMQDEYGLLRAVNRILPRDPQTELVLVIDQFEEIFTLLEDESIRTHLLKSLRVAVLSSDSRMRLIITMRADFYDRPLLYPGFSQLMRQRTEVVIPLTPEELERAIVKPIQRIGVTPEPELVATIIEDVGQQPGTLPLLQYALTELFERRTGRILTLDIYKQSGGVLGSLARRADELYQQLNEQEREATRQLFLRLVTLGEGTQDTRRRIVQTELHELTHSQAPTTNQQESTYSPLEHVIEAFSKYRLLTLDHDPTTRSPTIEVAHEALIQTWEQLRSWLNTSREHLRIQRRLQATTVEWFNTNKDPSFLATGARLIQFETLLTESDLALSQREHQYLQASIAERTRQEAIEKQRLEQERLLKEQAIAQKKLAVAQWFAAEAKNLMQSYEDPTLIALLAIRSITSAYTSSGDTALLMAATLAYPSRIFVNHTNKVRAVAFSPDGTQALTGGEDNTARLWNIRTGSQVMVCMGHEDWVNQVAFSPNGQFVLTASFDHTARLWNRHTGQVVQCLRGHTKQVHSIAFSPDGKYIITGSSDMTTRLWDTYTGNQIRAFTGHEDEIFSVAFSPGGKYIITGYKGAEVWMWETATAKPIRRFRGHTGTVYAVAFSPDRKTILTGSGDTTARLWDIRTGEELQSFETHTTQVRDVAFAPDGRHILTGSLDRTVRLWNMHTGKEQRIFHAGVTYSVAFAPDGLSILTGSSDQVARLWDIQSRAGPPQFVGHTDKVDHATFLPDGEHIVTGAFDRTAMLWNVRTGEHIHTFTGHTGEILEMALSQDGNMLATASADRTARLWDMCAGTQRIVLQGHEDTVWSIAIAPDARTIITGSLDKTAYLWDAATGHVLHVLSGHEGTVWDVAFSPDGKYVLTGSADHTARLWEVATGRQIHVLTGHTDAIWEVRFSPDGTLALTASDDRTARLWNIQQGHALHILTDHTDRVYAAEFSPDGHYVVTTDHLTAQLWDVATGQQRRVFTGHSDEVFSAVFSPDGKYILTGSMDNTARLWDSHTGKALRRYSGHKNILSQVAFSPDGQYILTASADHTARLWYVDYHQAVRHLCSQLMRDFNEHERMHYNISDNKPTCRQ